MAGAGTHVARRVVLPALALVGAALMPSAVDAADDATLVLPGTTIGAATADLDGDGDREIIRLLHDGAPTEHVLDAWDQDGSGWSMLDSIPLPRAGDQATTVPGSVDAVALLPWTVAGRDRILAISAQVGPDSPGAATCCLAISEVRLVPDGRLELALLQGLDSAAQSMMAADVDGDGNDDLVLFTIPFGPGGRDEAATVSVHRWAGSGFELIFEDTDARWLHAFSLGNSDGVAGEDLLLAPTADGSLQRLAWVDGAMREEVAHIDLGGPNEAWVAGVAEGAILVSVIDEVRLIRWPRDEDAVTVNAVPALTYSGIMLVGEGPDALVGLQDGFGFERGRPPSMTLHDLELRRLGEVRATSETDEFWSIAMGRGGPAWNSLQVNLYPYTGPLHGVTLEGRSVFAASGMLIRPGGPDGYDARPMASMIGMQPIGVAGPDDGWAVLSDTFGAGSSSAYLQWGGLPFGLGRLIVMPVDDLLRPDDEVAAPSFELRNAVEVSADGSAANLQANGAGYQVAVSAPEGSLVLVAVDARLEEHRVGDEALIVEVVPPTRSEDGVNQEIEAMVVVVTPDGRGTTRRWTGTFVREPPEISIRATTDAMALRATIEGRATPGSTVTVNGRPIQTNADGRFDASVEAPLWPSHVVVTASDPLGNVATERIEVVGGVDYRGLPWPGMMVGATLIVGGVLYVRTPRRRAVRAAPDGDGRLEEIELDALDGIEPGSR